MAGAASSKIVKAPVVDDDEDLLDDDLDGDLDEEDDEEPVVPVSKKKAAPPVDDEDEEDSTATVHKPTAPAPRKMPVAVAAKPVITSPPPGEEDLSDAEFDREAKKRRDKQKVDDFLEKKRSDETISVDEITELMMAGDSDKILHELVAYCADNTGIKKAKQLLREGRDRAKARITRIAGIVAVDLDELKEKDDSSDGGYRD